MAFDARLVPLILSLGLDTFALSTALGVAPVPAQTRLRLALTFAAAEGPMPAVGLLLGRPLGDAIGGWAVYIAAVLLIGTGAWLLHESLQGADGDGAGDEGAEGGEAGGEGARIMRAATSHGLPVIGLALSVSLDELAMGFSFGVLRVPVAPVLIAIAVQVLVVSVGGQWIGQRVGAALGERAEVAGGVILCVLGLAVGLGRLVDSSGL